MKGLVLKILRGNYPAIPSHYSDDIRGLLAEMLKKDPKKRPSVRKILEKEFLAVRISQLLSKTIAKYEPSQSTLKKAKEMLPPSSKLEDYHKHRKLEVLEENKTIENKNKNFEEPVKTNYLITGQ